MLGRIEADSKRGREEWGWGEGEDRGVHQYSKKARDIACRQRARKLP